MKFSHRIELRTAGLGALTAALTLACWMARDGAAQQQRGGAGNREVGESSAERQHFKQREGTTIETTGSFKLSGERAIFTAEDGAHFYGLENLNLERIAIATNESPDPLQWNITGTITEFRGANYLLITRAMLKSKVGATSKGLGVHMAKPRFDDSATKP